MMCANHPDRERVAFCQNCGKPLCQECTRTIGSAVFCEQCLAEKIAAATPPPPAGNPWTSPVPPPAADPSAPNPGLAGLLGFIPGVGAMYNGQFAKGIVHLAIFAVLVSMADNVNGIFGLFVAGWVFYMVFEAYQTAKARRDGLPLPNPFGLNEIGEKFGFGKAWPATHATGPDTAKPVDPVMPPVPPPPASAYGSPYFCPPPSSYTMPPVPPVDPNWRPRNRFPAGAIWLIGLGALFLLGSTHIELFRLHHWWPLIVIAVGVWSFISRMQATGPYLSNDGSALYRWRVVTALRSSGWLLITGILGLCNTLLDVSWKALWPFFLIYLGLSAIIERSAWSQAAADMHYPGTPAPTTPTGVGMVPAAHEEESK